MADDERGGGEVANVITSLVDYKGRYTIAVRQAYCTPAALSGTMDSCRGNRSPHPTPRSTRTYDRNQGSCSYSRIRGSIGSSPSSLRAPLCISCIGVTCFKVLDFRS